MSKAIKKFLRKFLQLPHQTLAALVLLFFLIIAYGSWRYIQAARELAEIKINPAKIQELSRNENKKIVEAVGKLMELPKGEEPTVAIVSNVERLKNQPFFALAQNDDRVLIFTNAKRAILYRPATNKIIDVAPINIGGTATSSAQVSTATVSAQLPTLSPKQSTATVSGQVSPAR